MKKFIVEIVLLKNDFLYPRLYCVDEYGGEDEAVSLTLCDAVWELNGEPLLELVRLVTEAYERGNFPIYVDEPVMSINDKFIWIRHPSPSNGGICISNENVPEFSVDEGSPQYFTFAQFNLVAKLALKFQSEVTTHGKDSLVGKKFEMDFPIE